MSNSRGCYVVKSVGRARGINGQCADEGEKIVSIVRVDTSGEFPQDDSIARQKRSINILFHGANGIEGPVGNYFHEGHDFLHQLECAGNHRPTSIHEE